MDVDRLDLQITYDPAILVPHGTVSFGSAITAAGPSLSPNPYATGTLAGAPAVGTLDLSLSTMPLSTLEMGTNSFAFPLS